MLISGKKIGCANTIDVRNAFTGEVIDSVTVARARDIENAAAVVSNAASTVGKLSKFERYRILTKTAQAIERRSEEFSTRIVAEAGKVIVQARKEVARYVNTLTLSAEEAKKNHGEVIAFDSFDGHENRQGFFKRFPIGVVLAITSYNDPLNLVAHKLGPAVAAGNAILFKPSELAPLSGIALAEVLIDSGFPADALAVVTGDAETGKRLVRLPCVNMISFTGGIVTGEAIARSAGLKRLSVDLGGNAAVIVMADSDIDHAVASCVSGAFWAAGQNCIGVQRILI